MVSKKLSGSEQEAALVKALNGRPIILIGLMGAGKTTIGRRLAKRLSIPFRDADHEIEAAANLSVAEIFSQHGEAHFRDGEKKVIARLLEQGTHVLATGGGAWMNEETRSTVKGRGVSVWLKAEFDILMERVRRRSHRPLLQDPDPEGVMHRLIDERYPVYAEADLTVMSRDVPHEAIVGAVVDALEDYVKANPS
ncbi:shikimate kinase [Cohaesibacter gelatinilyticus]|uniref:Shikimate kinase n=1 Tax=Cohaesibacter gelatinilyticus TaxID=372072 RepID=A0A285PID0_9HYPH|nr:shikimate kinase [Cohaesibacter gelatinilyticus]SNZ21490.1 shikimate kinase [Cohaesibacter gelatinilyticus]